MFTKPFIKQAFILTVSGDVNGGWHLFNLHLESLLNLFKDLVVFWAAHEADSQTLGSESSGSAHSVQVGVRVLWHVKVEDYVDLLDVNTSSEDVSGDHDSVLEGFEVIVSLDSS